MSKPMTGLICAIADALAVATIYHDPSGTLATILVGTVVFNVLIITWMMIDTAGER